MNLNSLACCQAAQHPGCPGKLTGTETTDHRSMWIRSYLESIIPLTSWLPLLWKGGCCTLRACVNSMASLAWRLPELVCGRSKAGELKKPRHAGSYRPMKAFGCAMQARTSALANCDESNEAWQQLFIGCLSAAVQAPPPVSKLPRHLLSKRLALAQNCTGFRPF